MSATLTSGVPFADYLALPGEHFSSLKALDMSPLHYRHALAHPASETAPMTLGRITHAMILTPAAPPEIAIYDGAMRRGKRWEAFKEDHPGKAILLRGDPAVVTALAMRAAVERHPIARELLRAGEGEVTMTWEVDGVACRGRLDWLWSSGIVELKTTRSIHPRAFAREVAQRLYHVQLALYTDGLTAVLGHAPPELPILIAIENTPPHDVCVYRVGFDSLEAGQRKVDGWLRTIRECRASGQWPGCGGDGVLDLRLPDWALADEEQSVDLSGIGG